VSPGRLAARPFTLAAVRPSKTGVNALSDRRSFALLRHMASNPLHVIVMLAAMAALMAAAMMLMR